MIAILDFSDLKYFFKLIKNFIIFLLNFLISILEKLYGFVHTNKNFRLTIFFNLFFSMIIFFILQNSFSLYYLLISFFLPFIEYILLILIYVLKKAKLLISNTIIIFNILFYFICNLFALIVLSSFSMVFSFEVISEILNNAFFYQKYFFILITFLLLNLAFMFIFSLIFHVFFISKFKSRTTFDIVDLFLKFLTTIVFTLIIGLKTQIINSIDFSNSSLFNEEILYALSSTFHFSMSDILSIIIYLLFSYLLCFQMTHNVAKKIIPKTNVTPTNASSDSDSS